MDQIEAIAGVLEACARLARRLSSDGAAEIGAELFAASTEMESTARRLKDAAAGLRNNASS